MDLRFGNREAISVAYFVCIFQLQTTLHWRTQNRTGQPSRDICELPDGSRQLMLDTTPLILYPSYFLCGVGVKIREFLSVFQGYDWTDWRLCPHYAFYMRSLNRVLFLFLSCYYVPLLTTVLRYTVLPWMCSQPDTGSEILMARRDANYTRHEFCCCVFVIIIAVNFSVYIFHLVYYFYWWLSKIQNLIIKVQVMGVA